MEKMEYEARGILLELTENIDIEIFNCLVMFDHYEDYLGDQYSHLIEVQCFHLIEVISKRIDASENAQEKRILKSLIRYIYAARDYLIFRNTKKNTGKKGVKGIVEHIGFQEIKRTHKYILKELNEGLNCLDSHKDIKSIELFKDKISSISYEFKRYEEENNRLFNAEIRDKLKNENVTLLSTSLSEIYGHKSLQEIKNIIENEIKIRKVDCIKKKKMHKLFRDLKWISLIFLIAALLLSNFTFYLLGAIASGAFVTFALTAEPGSIHLPEDINEFIGKFLVYVVFFLIGFIFAPIVPLLGHGLIENDDKFYNFDIFNEVLIKINKELGN